ncbi:hypothetical protein ICN18_01230 [Polynucleobacter sp. Ross1-W9]|uniref:hypothetical protein n=1 Tax=Polynucleobacter parvulilacunae TaxID=1855631 RepID=UPI001C0DE481|nr:hypothetical protein [Polynucleobacter parvulilacunae]MBU3556248.1 hypothetical protein [Polynucleobacter parvulilacunae]
MKKSILIGFILCLFLVGCDGSPFASSKIEVKRFVLYKTQNMWNFLLLDSRNGRIWQEQYSIKDGYSGPTVLSSKILTDKEVDGRFYLTATDNMWNFLLTDSLDGRVWQCQWGFEEKNRFCSEVDIATKNL